MARTLTGEACDLLVVDEVLDGHFDLLKVVKHIELGEVQRVVAVDQAGVLHHHQVEPATAPATASGRTILVANLLEVRADVLRAASIVGHT